MLFLQLCKSLESPGILLKVLEKSFNFYVKSPGKSEKKFWRVLEFESVFLVGTMTWHNRSSLLGKFQITI